MIVYSVKYHSETHDSAVLCLCHNVFFYSSGTGMSGAKDLVLSEATHKAFVEVNEEGTEAAAVTSCYSECLCGNSGLVHFTADHPFLFFIRHNTTMSVLFSGRFCSPEWALCPLEQRDSNIEEFHLLQLQ